MNKTQLSLYVVAVSVLYNKLVAMFNCLVRSDYNLVVALVCYYFNASETKSDRISYVVRFDDAD